MFATNKLERCCGEARLLIQKLLLLIRSELIDQLFDNPNLQLEV